MNAFEFFENGYFLNRDLWSSFHRRIITEWKNLVRPENLSLRQNGTAAVSLQVPIWNLVSELQAFGTFLACTGNSHAMISHPIRYPRFRECRCKGRAIDPAGGLAVLLDDSMQVSAIQESIRGVITLGLEFRNQHGELKHRCCLLPDADWRRFVQKLSEWQPGGARGLRLDKAARSGHWNGCDQSARVWVEEQSAEVRNPVRSWLVDYRARRRGLIEKNDPRFTKICPDHFRSVVTSASISRRRLGITVPNEHFVESFSIVPDITHQCSGALRLETGDVQFQFSLAGLVEFFRADLRNRKGTAYEAYDENGDLAVAFHDAQAI